jgi:hypothetical protein
LSLPTHNSSLLNDLLPWVQPSFSKTKQTGTWAIILAFMRPRAPGFITHRSKRTVSCERSRGGLHALVVTLLAVAVSLLAKTHTSPSKLGELSLLVMKACGVARVMSVQAHTPTPTSRIREARSAILWNQLCGWFVGGVRLLKPSRFAKTRCPRQSSQHP